MADNRAFKLAAGYEDFGGGSLAYGGEAYTFSVGDALRGPDGKIDPSKVIVVNDEQLINALADYAPLESTDVPPEVEETVVTEEAPAKSGRTPLSPVPDVEAVHGDDGDE